MRGEHPFLKRTDSDEPMSTDKRNAPLTGEESAPSESSPHDESQTVHRISGFHVSQETDETMSRPEIGADATNDRTGTGTNPPEMTLNLEASDSSDTLISLPVLKTNTSSDSNLNNQSDSSCQDEDQIQKRNTSMENHSADTPTYYNRKSKGSLLSLPEIRTNTTTDTSTTIISPDELLEYGGDEDETDSREATAAQTRPQQQPQDALQSDAVERKFEYFVREKTSSVTDTDGDYDDPTDCGAGGSSSGGLTIPEIGTDTTYSTEDDDSTASKPLLRNLSEVALFLYESDNIRDARRNDERRGYKKDPAILEQIMPREPGGMMTSSEDAKFEQEEEKIEVHDEYATAMDHSSRRSDEPEEVVLNRNPSPPEPIPVQETRPSDTYIVKNTRAEYVSATVLKLDADYEHGLEFVSIDGGLRISSISSSGLFCDSPLKPFDRVLRINNLNCESLDPVNASHLMNVLTGFVILIAQNIGGDSSLIESQISKPRPDSEVGISFKDICRDAVLRKNEVEITRLGDKSLFTGSLLHVGDRVLSVNQSVDIDSNLIDVMLKTSPRHVTVLAQTKLRTQMAIARRPTHQLPPGYNFVRAMAEARRQRAELRRKQGCYYNMCERPGACANIFQWVGNVYVITIVIVGVVISWETVKEQTYDGSDTVGTILKFMGLFVGGILLGFLVNAPWWFRKVGARFSVAQLVCNAIVIASFFILTRFFDSADLVQDYRLVIFFAIFFPLLIIVNLPTIFVKKEDGSDGNTISDRSRDDDDDLSSDSNMTSDNTLMDYP